MTYRISDADIDTGPFPSRLSVEEVDWGGVPVFQLSVYTTQAEDGETILLSRENAVKLIQCLNKLLGRNQHVAVR
jgi:hypothetical protein